MQEIMNQHVPSSWHIMISMQLEILNISMQAAGYFQGECVTLCNEYRPFDKL